MISLEMEGQLSTILGTSSTSGGAGVEWAEWPDHNNQVNTDISPPPSFSPELMYDPYCVQIYTGLNTWVTVIAAKPFKTGGS